MTLLLRDIVRRRWWYFLIAALLPLAGTLNIDEPVASYAMVFVVLYGPLLLFMFEGASDPLRAYLILPQSRRTQGRTLWVECVMLFPAIVLGGQLLLRAVNAIVPLSAGIIEFPLFFALCLLSMGCASGVVLTQIIPTPMKLSTGFRFNLWGLITEIPALIILAGALFFLHRFIHPDAPLVLEGDSPLKSAYALLNRMAGPREHLFGTVNVLVLCASLAAVILSYTKARTLLEVAARLRTRHKLTGSAKKTGKAAVFPSPLRGRMGPWLHALLRLLSFVTMLPIVTVAILGMQYLIEGGLENFEIDTWPLIFAVLVTVAHFGVAVPWLGSLRALRSLPLSRTRMALYLFSFPLLSFLAILAVLALVFLTLQDMDHFLLCLSWSIITLAQAYAACAICVRFGPNVTAVFLLLSLGGLVLLGNPALSEITPTTIAVVSGVSALLAALTLMDTSRTVATSSKTYRRAALMSAYFGGPTVGRD